jgi:hypothetical protein
MLSHFPKYRVSWIPHGEAPRLGALEDTMTNLIRRRLWVRGARSRRANPRLFPKNRKRSEQTQLATDLRWNKKTPGSTNARILHASVPSNSVRSCSPNTPDVSYKIERSCS